MHPYHSARPVAARWHRINDLIDCGRRPCHELDDAWIRRGWAYVLRLRACRLQHDRDNLSREFPDMDAAYRLNTSDDKMEHAVVEARLLARQTVSDVAGATNLQVGAVTAYEAIFFQVLGRLDAFLFILPNAVGVAFSGEGLHETDTDVLVKLYAYKMGPMFLERILPYVRNGLRIPEHLDRASRDELEELVTALKTRALFRAKVLPHPQCNRAILLTQLADELKTVIADLFDANGRRLADPGVPATISCLATINDARVSAYAGFPASTTDWWAAFRDVTLVA